MRVLIVDDNVENVALLKAVAEDGGLRNLYTETDSRMVQCRLIEQSPDLVLLDLRMPHLDGFEVLAQIKEHAAGAYLPVLVLTADGTTDARDAALTQGAQDFLTKPLDIVEVTLRMANLLETRKLYINLDRGRGWLAASGELTNRLLTAGSTRSRTLITECALKASGADFAVLVVPSRDDMVKVAAVSGIPDRELTDQVSALGTSCWARTIQTGTPDIIRESRAVDRQPPFDAAVGPILCLPLTIDGVTGALALGRTTGGVGLDADELTMAASFARQASVALELVKARDAEVDVARREDRDRIAADLHDHVIQDLFAVGIGLQGLAGIAKNPQLVSRIRLYVEGLDRAIGTMRTTIFQLQPDRHAAGGLKTRILDIVDEHTAQLGYTPQVRFTGPLDHAVNDDLAGDVLAVVREGISNCARHAQASRLDLTVGITQNILTLEVTDNGRGIGTPTRSSGLRNMRSRAQRKGGSLAFTTPSQGGTRLTWKRSLI
jgi:signal transduction histidine kinase